MKLVTFQSFKALESLFKNGYLECDEKFINLEKTGPTYNWVLEKMNEQVENKYNTKYPLWCWVKVYDGICPKKQKGNAIKTFNAKITFNKDENDIFVTDFRRYSFVLKNMYIPSNIKDKEDFSKLLIDKNITLEELKAYVRPDKYETCREDKKFLDVCKKIRKSFDKCITSDSDILQGCVWRIYLEDIEKIEILKDDGFVYGSLNYIRSDGKRKDWVEEFYKNLK